MYICEYMTPEPLTISPKTSLMEARKILDAFQFRHLPVVSENLQLLGIITDRDLRSAFPSSIGSKQQQEGEYEVLGTTPVADIMTTSCTTLSPDATLDDALLLFDRDKVGGLPVVDDAGIVKGMFSIRDLTAAYKDLFGVSDKGSVLIGIADTGEVGIMASIVNILEQNGITFTRLIRMQGELGKGSIYLRINTFRLASVYNVLKQNGLTIIKPNCG